MDDTQDLQMIDQAFDAFRAGGPIGDPLGADLVRRTVSRRRKVRAVAAGALAAIVLAVPVTAYATGMIQTKHGPPMVGTSTDPSPSEVPSPATQSTGPTPTTSAPDGRSTKDQLSHATLDFSGNPNPDGLCPSGKFQFKGFPTTYTRGPGLGEVRVKVDEVVDVDFDHDGALETVASISCAVQGASHVVLALDRDADGRIVTVAPVVWGYENGAVGTIFDVRADANGVVGVQVGDVSPCCGTTEEMVEHQWRGYAFDGRKFAQTTGPAKFTPVTKPNDLGVTITPVQLGKAVNGVRHGSTTATVHNSGPAKAPGALIEMYIGAYEGQKLPGKVTISTDLNDCATTTRTNNDGSTGAWVIRCHLYPFANGESRQFTFRFDSPASNDAAIQADNATTSNQFTVSAHVVEEQPGVRVFDTDTNPENNDATEQVTLA